jgi:hypothetical protein
MNPAEKLRARTRLALERAEARSSAARGGGGGDGDRGGGDVQWTRFAFNPDALPSGRAPDTPPRCNEASCRCQGSAQQASCGQRLRSWQGCAAASGVSLQRPSARANVAFACPHAPLPAPRSEARHAPDTQRAGEEGGGLAHHEPPPQKQYSMHGLDEEQGLATLTGRRTAELGRAHAAAKAAEAKHEAAIFGSALPLPPPLPPPLPMAGAGKREGGGGSGRGEERERERRGDGRGGGGERDARGARPHVDDRSRDRDRDGGRDRDRDRGRDRDRDRWAGWAARNSPSMQVYLDGQPS